MIIFATMGQKKKQAMGDISFELSRMMVPRDFLEYFAIVEVKELSNEWQIILHEKEHLIPDNLQGNSDVVLDGFCNQPVFSVGCCKINIVEKMVSTFDYSHCKFFKNILYDSQGHKFIPGVATLKTGRIKISKA